MSLYKRNRSARKGFTLIELLVVIAIIGILSSVVLASLNSARGGARDVKRMTDMKQLQIALELYHATHSQYPRNPSGTSCSTCLAGATNADWTGAGQMPAFLPAIPVDPTRTGSSGYRYQVVSGRQSYTMLVQLEKNSGWCRLGVNPGVASWDQYPVCE